MVSVRKKERQPRSIISGPACASYIFLCLEMDDNQVLCSIMCCIMCCLMCWHRWYQLKLMGRMTFSIYPIDEIISWYNTSEINYTNNKCVHIRHMSSCVFSLYAKCIVFIFLTNLGYFYLMLGICFLRNGRF